MVADVKLPLQDHDVFDVLDLKGVVPFAQSSHGCSLNLAITFVGCDRFLQPARCELGTAPWALHCISHRAAAALLLMLRLVADHTPCGTDRL